METDYSMRGLSVTFARIAEAFRPDLQRALKHLRCGYAPAWASVRTALKWMGYLAETLQSSAEIEIMRLNRQRSDNEQLEPYRKPRWYTKKAPPKPQNISLACQETFLEGLLRWLDAMKANTEAPPGVCHPHLPDSLKAMLLRNGYDPNNWRSPSRLVREYLTG